VTSLSVLRGTRSEPNQAYSLRPRSRTMSRSLKIGALESKEDWYSLGRRFVYGEFFGFEKFFKAGRLRAI